MASMAKHQTWGNTREKWGDIPVEPAILCLLEGITKIGNFYDGFV